MKKLLPLLLCLTVVASGCSAREDPSEPDSMPDASSSSQTDPTTSNSSQPLESYSKPIQREEALAATIPLPLDADIALLHIGVSHTLEFANWEDLPELPSNHYGYVWTDGNFQELSGLIVFPEEGSELIEGPTLHFVADGSGITHWEIENNAGTPITVTADGKTKLVDSVRGLLQAQVPALLEAAPAFDTLPVGTFTQEQDGSFNEGYEPLLTLHEDGTFAMVINGLSYMAELRGSWQQSPYRVELHNLQSDTLDLPQDATIVFTILSNDQLCYLPTAGRAPFQKGGVSLGATMENALFLRNAE